MDSSLLNDIGAIVILTIAVTQSSFVVVNQSSVIETFMPEEGNYVPGDWQYALSNQRVHI